MTSSSSPYNKSRSFRRNQKSCPPARMPNSCPSQISNGTLNVTGDEGKVPTMLWNLLKLIFKNMYKDLSKVKLSLSKSYITQLNNYLSHGDSHIRKLTLLIVVVRLKFEKRFRRRWMQAFPHSIKKKRIMLGKKW